MLCIRGKPGNHSRGKFTFPLRCSRAFLGQKPSNFPSPQRGRRSLFAYPNSKISPIAGPGSSGPWRRSGGAQPPASSSHPLTTRAQKKSEPKRFAFSSAQGLLYRRGQDLSNTIFKCRLIGKIYNLADALKLAKYHLRFLPSMYGSQCHSDDRKAVRKNPLARWDSDRIE